MRQLSPELDTYFQGIAQDLRWCEEKTAGYSYADQHGKCPDTKEMANGLAHLIDTLPPTPTPAVQSLRNMTRKAFVDRLQPEGADSFPKEFHVWQQLLTDIRETANTLHACLTLPRRFPRESSNQPFHSVRDRPLKTGHVRQVVELEEELYGAAAYSSGHFRKYMGKPLETTPLVLWQNYQGKHMGHLELLFDTDYESDGQVVFIDRNISLGTFALEGDEEHALAMLSEPMRYLSPMHQAQCRYHSLRHKMHHLRSVYREL